MAVGLSTTNMANAMLNGVNNTSFAITTTFVQIHTDAGDPGASGTSNVSAGSTTRPSIAFSAASSGALAITGTLPQWTNGGTTENIKYISIWSASTAGTFYWSAQLTTTKSWASGDTLTLNTCGLSLSPLAA